MYTKVANKMTYANSAGPDQTAPEGAVWSGSTLHVFVSPLSILHVRNTLCKSTKSKIWAKKLWSKVFEILGHLPYKCTYMKFHVRAGISLIRYLIIRSILVGALPMSTHNMFSWRNKKNVSFSWLRKKQKTVPYLKLCWIVSYFFIGTLYVWYYIEMTSGF